MSKLRKQLLQEKLKNAPEQIQKMHMSQFDRMNFRDDDDFESFLNEVEQDMSNLGLKNYSGKPSEGYVLNYQGEDEKEFIQSVVKDIMPK